MSAFLLWPLAVVQLTPRAFTHLYNTLTKEPS